MRGDSQLKEELRQEQLSLERERIELKKRIEGELEPNAFNRSWTGDRGAVLTEEALEALDRANKRVEEIEARLRAIDNKMRGLK